MSNPVAFLLIVLYYGQLLFSTCNRVHLGVTRYPKKSIPSPKRNACHAGCTWLNSLAHRYIETTTYEKQPSSFLECFLTILEFDWLRKRVTARVTPIQLLPVRKTRQLVSVIRRCQEKYIVKRRETKAME